ncbi:MAG: YheU family protein [Glaciecola sp.]|jgi:uncharacterized protein YheU (UPF0270 family)
MIIPHTELDPDTLYAVIESFVLREGTDYGMEEASMAEKIAQVKAQLDSGHAVLVYSELHESVDIQPAEQWRSANL